MAKSPRKSEEVIQFNSYQNEVFSALWPAPFIYKKLTFKSIEHGYQYFKLAKSEEELRRKILNAFDPYRAKYYGSDKAKGKQRKDHDVKRIDTMRRMIKESYMQNPLRLLALLATGKTKLSHLAQWDKGGWGVNDQGKGADMMGVLLMEFRDSMKGADVWKVCKEHTMMRLAELVE